MKLATKSLWLIESRLFEDILISELASELEVSVFHLTRAFSTSFNISPSRYLRLRRLANFAKRLIETDERILDIALAAGYSSHEAFTRALRNAYNITPENLRKQPKNIKLLEPLTMQNDHTIKLAKPQIKTISAFEVSGINHQYKHSNSAGIPEQWAKLNQSITTKACDSFGVCHRITDNTMDYFCGFQTKDIISKTIKLDILNLVQQKYAVFHHHDHISEIQAVWKAIWDYGLTETGVTAISKPSFEKYSPEFSSRTGDGGFEIWIPIKDKN